MQDLITSSHLEEHVTRLGEEHAPLRLEAVDRTIVDPVRARERYGNVIEYLSRVELEVDRNLLELLTLLPQANETDRRFFTDVWQPQEIQHGRILDQLQQDLGMAPAEPDTTTISPKIRILGALAHLRPVHDVVRLLYYLTGAATEKSTVLAYTALHDGMKRLGERAVAQTVVAPVRRQEPGHFVFYRMSAMAMVQNRVLAPWQVWLTRILRQHSFGVVGANNAEQRADFGGLVTALELDGELPRFARQIALVESQLLWAQRQGMVVPGYVLAALRDAVDRFRARESGT